jgi:predicted Zn-dependent protease
VWLLKLLGLLTIVAVGSGAVGMGLFLVMQEVPQLAPTEIDDPAVFAYVDSRDSCAEFGGIQDVIKDMAFELDRLMRDLQPISAAEEGVLGDEVLAKLPEELGGRLVSSGTDVEYMAAVAAPMLEHVSRQDLHWRFHVLEDTDVENALALPGGHIVFTRPLLDRWFHNEAQLAAVLSHEISHIEHRHPVAVVQYTRALGLPEDNVLSHVAMSLARMPYSSKLEEEADREGVLLMGAVDYSLFQAVSLWEDRAAEQPAAKNRGLLGELEALLSSHPEPERRACLLRQQTYDHYQRHPNALAYVGTTNLTRQIPQSEERY